jgi:hypothetical protein
MCHMCPPPGASIPQLTTAKAKKRSWKTNLKCRIEQLAWKAAAVPGGETASPSWRNHQEEAQPSNNRESARSQERARRTPSIQTPPPKPKSIPGVKPIEVTRSESLKMKQVFMLAIVALLPASSKVMFPPVPRRLPLLALRPPQPHRQGRLHQARPRRREPQYQPHTLLATDFISSPSCTFPSISQNVMPS